MAIQVDHGIGAASFANPLYGAARNDQRAALMLPFVGQYISQAHESGEAAKQRGWQAGQSSLQRDWQSGESLLGRDWQTGESAAQRGWQSGESALDRNLTMYGNDKQLAMQALLAQYQAQAQLASQRISSGRPLNPMHINRNLINGAPASQYRPDYGGPGALDYQSILSMPSYQQPLLTSNTTSRYQRG